MKILKTIANSYHRKFGTLSASNYDEYLSHPKEEREARVWFWPFPWYKMPYAMEMRILLSKKPDEWDKFYAYVRKHYPVQYFFRKSLLWTVSGLKSDLNDLKYKIKNRLINPRREMRSAVFPPEYQDLDTHIVTFHLQCIIEFVDREECFSSTDYTQTEADRAFGKELREHYEYAKVVRASLVKAIEDAYCRAVRETESIPYAVRYKEVNETEAILEEKDTKLCEWVIKNRGRLWT